jgi:hypothetical protein
MKTSELIGPALDWAVAKCEPYGKEFGVSLRFNKPFDWGDREFLEYSTNWAQGGPIIEREKITLLFHDGYITNDEKTWYACLNFNYDGMEVQQQFSQQGETPLIAAMRCYVTSKLGDDVNIPKELM